MLEAGGFTFPPKMFLKVPEDWYKDDIDLAAEKKRNRYPPTEWHANHQRVWQKCFWQLVNGGAGNTATAYFVYKLPFKQFAIVCCRNNPA